MPIFKKESKNKSAERILQDLLKEYDISTLQEAVANVLFGENSSMILKDEETKEVLTFKRAKEIYFKSSRFNSLSETSKKTYKCEMRMLEKRYIEKLEKGVETPFEELFTRSEYNIEILRYINEGVKENTKQKKKAFLRSFILSVTFDFYQKHKEVFKSILKINTCKNSMPKYLELEQVREILNLSKQTSAAYRNYTILKVLLGSGIRINELIMLKIGDIREGTQDIMVSVKGSKGTKKPRKINSEALKILLNYIEFIYSHLKDKEYYNELYVFSGDGGKTPLTERTIQYMIKGLIQKADSIPEGSKNRLNCHNLRHTFAVHAYRSGIDIYTLSNLLGHASISSTEIYLALFDKELKEAIEKHPLSNLKI